MTSIQVDNIVANFHECNALLAAVKDNESYGEDYLRSKLQLDLCRRRLVRFAEAVGILEDPDYTGLAHLSSRTCTRVLNKAGDCFGWMKNTFEEAKTNDLENAKETKSPSAMQENETGSDNLFVHIIEKLKGLKLSEPLVPSESWALYKAKEERDRLVEDLDERLSILTDLFPPSTKTAQKEAAQADATATFRRLHRNLDVHKRNTLDTLFLEAICEGDFLHDAAKENLQPESGGHTYFGGHVYQGQMSASDNATIQLGDRYDGKSIFDD